MLSFIIPAHNEQQALPDTLEALARCTSELQISSETIVVDDASNDRTAEVAARHGATVVRVGFRHIAAARNAGAAVARGDILVFVDADTIVLPRTLAAALAALAAGAVAGGARVALQPGAPLWGRAVWAVASWYYFRRRLAAGCFVFSRREAFHAAGRFDEAYFATEEIHLSRALQAQGRFVVVSDAVITSGRKFHLITPWRFAREALKLARAGWTPYRTRHYWWYGPQRGGTSATSDASMSVRGCGVDR
jgi:glycosyltransferase involved in cell wall biosynthesis